MHYSGPAEEPPGGVSGGRQTQSFNTTTSMGRLTLNILLSLTAGGTSPHSSMPRGAGTASVPPPSTGSQVLLNKWSKPIDRRVPEQSGAAAACDADAACPVAPREARGARRCRDPRAPLGSTNLKTRWSRRWPGHFAGSGCWCRESFPPSRFSRSSAVIRSAISLETPGRLPPTTSAFLTRSFRVWGAHPIFDEIDRAACQRDPCLP